MVDDGGHRPGSPAYRRTASALFLAGVATFAAVWTTQPLLPTLAADFAVTPARAALSVSGPTLALGAFVAVFNGIGFRLESAEFGWARPWPAWSS